MQQLQVLQLPELQEGLHLHRRKDLRLLQIVLQEEYLMHHIHRELKQHLQDRQPEVLYQWIQNGQFI